MSKPPPLQQAKAEPQQSMRAAEHTGSESANGLVDARPHAAAQRKLQDMADGSAQVKQLHGYSQLMQAATQNPIQMARSETIGNISYDTEDFSHEEEEIDRERVSKVVISGRNKSDDTAPQPAHSFYNFDEQEYESMEGFHSGHVAARQFGGTYRDINMVPMLPNFNIGEWKNVESEMAEHIGKKVITVEPGYGDDDERVPDEFAVDISGVNSFTVAHDVPERKAFGKGDMDFIAKESKVKKSKDYALEFLEGAHEKGWIPDNYKDSPYLPLDILWLNGIKGEGNPGSRVGFKSWQIDWLIKYNRGLNGGDIESDAWTMGTTEPHQHLWEAGRLSRPEADHIVPNLSGGSNLFTNARLVSWELNNSLERNVAANLKHLKW